MTNDRYRLMADAVRSLFRSHGHVLSVRRAGGSDPAPEQLAGAGDHLEEGESLDQAARVESGIDVDPHRQEFCGLVHDVRLGEDRITPAFVAQSWSGKPHHAEPDRHDGLFRAAVGKASQDCRPYTVAICRLLAERRTYLALHQPVPTRGGAS
ncbi:NUDIX domain-containing protein [Streptomyces sp. NPDC059460]|uniref:NUDIX domain-containing protein n=1 Tax=Streptomyces sp. NPDC059460 TaxID=3346840 RepID=UPI0036AD1335